jgi:hypothetical protein
VKKKTKRIYQGEINKAKYQSWKEYCNVEASVNPWSQVYKIAVGKTKEAGKMTTINKPGGTETTSLHETISEILDYLYKEDTGDEQPHHKTIRKAVEEPLSTEDDVEFTPGEIKHTIDSFSQKKAPGIDGITGGIYQCMFNMIPRTITSMYNQCLKLGIFPKRWKIAKLILAPKHKENCRGPNMYRPISLLNTGGKILDKLLINRINHYLYKNDLLSGRQYGFTPQRNTIDAIKEAQSFIQPIIENRGLVIMTSLDVQGAFDSAWWPAILQGL